MIVRLVAFASLLGLGLTGCAQPVYYPRHYSHVVSHPRAPVIETATTSTAVGNRAMAY